MAYCTVQQVKDAIDFPTDAPIADSIIQEFIYDAEEEIEEIYHTHFGCVEDSGTADGDYSTTTFSDSTKSWTVDDYEGYVVWIYNGTGSGQYREIISNTATKLTVSPAFDTTPDGTSEYRITKLGYADDTRDGNGTNTMFTTQQPIINLNALSVNSVDATVSTVYVYNESGKLVIGGTGCEISTFLDNEPQLVNMKYVYGVYPLPRIIQRLAICLAAMRTLIAQIAGTYDDFTNVSLPAGLSASKGEPYMNIQSSLNYLQGEARGIVFGTGKTEAVTGDFRSWNTYRPFTFFG